MMKKNFISFNSTMLKMGAAALLLGAMAACSDDAVTEDNGPVVGTTEPQVAEGVNINVLTNPSLARTFYNTHLNGSRAANDVPEFPGMPAAPTAAELSQMITLDAAFAGNEYALYVKLPAGTKESDIVEPAVANVYVPAGEYKCLPASFKVCYSTDAQYLNVEPWYVPDIWKEVTLSNVHYFIDGEVTIGGTGADAPMTISVLNGGKLTDKSVIEPQTTVYFYGGGDILRASQSGEDIIHFKGTFVSEADIIHADKNIEVLGDYYSTGKIHGKNITLVGGEVYAGCGVTAEETIYLTGDNSIISAGYVSAPVVEFASNSALTILLRDGGYLLATDQLRLKDIGNVFVKANENEYAMVETKDLLVNNKDLIGTFYNVAVKYDTQSGTQEMGANETSVSLIWNESVKVNGDVDYTVADGDACAPKIIEGPKDPEPDPTPELENIGEISPDDHQHPISATSIFTVGKDAYLSWHTQGANFHGCIEHLTVDAGTVTLNSFLETSPVNDVYGAIDFNHVIFDNGKIFVAGDHPRKGGILGWIDCENGKFPTGNTATLNLLQLYNEKFTDENGASVYSNGGSGNCIIRNGAYYQTASVAGFETFNVADFATAENKISSIAKLPSWTFDPSASAPLKPWLRDGTRTGKHIATDGRNVVMLTLINRSNTANTANASIKVYAASDVKYENCLASYVVNDVLLSPVDGKDVVAIEGSDIYVCLGQGGVKHLSFNGGNITELASFRLADKSKEELKGWDMSVKEAESYCANGLALDANYVYVAHGGAGVIVLNKADLSLVTRTRYHGGNSANYISINPDGYIYVAYGKSKVQVYAWKK